METQVQPNTHLNDCREEPPSYFNSITQPGIQLAPTIADAYPHPNQPNSKVKLPLYNYTASMAADTLPKPSTTIQPVTVVASQPRFNYGRPSSFTQSASGTAEQLFGASLFLGFLCAVFGSPITLICFVPAIYLSRKVKNYGERGESEKALKITSSVLALLTIGVLSGFIIIVTVVVLLVFVYNN